MHYGHQTHYVDNLFSEMVTVGEQLPAGHTAVQRSLRGSEDGRVSTTLRIFTTPLGNVKYTTDPSCSEIGKFDIPCSVNAREAFDFQLEFGSTEITALAVNTTTDEQRSVKLQYNFN